MVGRPISIGITALVSKTRFKEVSLVEVQRVQWYVHNTRKLFSPLAFGFVQLGLEALKNSSIHHFYFPIHPRVADRCELVLNVQLSAKLFEC